VGRHAGNRDVANLVAGKREPVGLAGVSFGHRDPPQAGVIKNARNEHDLSPVWRPDRVTLLPILEGDLPGLTSRLVIVR
jgi:hypothetical protein